MAAISIFLVLLLLIGALLFFHGDIRTKMFTVEVEMSGSDGFNYTRYHFQYFRGSKSKIIGVEEPSNLLLKYNIGFENGEFELLLKSLSGKVVWSKVTGDERDLQRIYLQEKGLYTLLVNAHEAKGYFDILWSTEKK